MPAEALDRASSETRSRGWGALAAMLLAGFTVQSLNGFGFLGTGGVAERVDQAVLLMLLAGGLLILVNKPQTTIRTLAGAWPFLLVIGFCVLSVVWAEHPGHALRRSVFLVIAGVIALSIAVGFDSVRRLHIVLMVVLPVIIVLNLASAFVWPRFAMSDIGFRGLHLSKNLAGITGMVAFACAAALALGAERLRTILASAFVAALALAFLLATDSKTSLALAVLTVGLATLLVAAWSAGPTIGAALSLLLAGMLAAGTFAAASADWGWAEVLTLLVGDPTFTSRTDIWNHVAGAIGERPMLGFGYGSYWDVGVENDPLRSASPGTWLGQVRIGVINQAHNGYIDLAVQIGIPAAAFATLAVIAWVAMATGLAASRTAGIAGRGAFLFHAFVLLQFLLHNMMEASLFSRTIGFGNFVLISVFVVSRWIAAAREDVPRERRGTVPRPA